MIACLHFIDNANLDGFLPLHAPEDRINDVNDHRHFYLKIDVRKKDSGEKTDQNVFVFYFNDFVTKQRH